jgi:hypothetical protein
MDSLGVMEHVKKSTEVGEKKIAKGGMQQR